jgi:hypothetical protein
MAGQTQRNNREKICGIRVICGFFRTGINHYLCGFQNTKKERRLTLILRVVLT